VSERARSFETAAAEYERHRPEYPEDALRWAADRLHLAPGMRVLDLGAGTGKLTRGLLALGLDVVAVEPGEPMLAQLRAALPDVEAVEGAAEAIPLPDASVDAVVAGQAYHWFDPSRAPTELRRVLRPGGGVALLWNWWDVRHPLQRRLCELLWGEVVADVGHEAPDPRLLEPLAETVVESVLRTRPDALVARVATTSALLTAEPGRREELLGRMRELAGGCGEDFDLPQLTFVYLYRRVS
jgi:ubiquinone/menaquinone biosynthesis C-methylase UbiE